MSNFYKYDKNPNCEWCRNAEDGICRLDKSQDCCDSYDYDIFKRVPKKQPDLSAEFSEEEFEL